MRYDNCVKSWLSKYDSSKYNLADDIKYYTSTISPASKFSNFSRFPISEGISPLNSFSPILEMKQWRDGEFQYEIQQIHTLQKKWLEKILPTSIICSDVTFPISDGICPVNSLSPLSFTISKAKNELQQCTVQHFTIDNIKWRLICHKTYPQKVPSNLKGTLFLLVSSH